MTDRDYAADLSPDEFEAMVAAALKVDPEGITGQRAKRRDDEDKTGEGASNET